MSEWISVNEDLPPSGLEVCVWTMMFSGMMFFDYELEDGEWFRNGDGNNQPDYKVTHWQYLPEPPEIE